MNKRIFKAGILLAVCILFIQCTFSNQKEKKTLAYTGEMRLYCKDLGGVFDTIDIVDGKGTYIQEKDEGKIVLVYTELDKHFAHYLVLEKGAITVKVSMDSCIIFGGTPNNESLGSLDRNMEPLRLAMHKLQHEDFSLLDSVSKKKKQEENSAKIQELAAEWWAFQREFTLTNNNMAGLVYVRKMANMFTSSELKEILEKYKSLSDNSVYQSIKRKYESSLRTDIGSIAPDFSLPDLEGKTFSLSNVQGKIILIDFWASWCGPCRKSIPHLKEIYSEFHNKGFDILSISTDTDKSKWEKALQEENMKWSQLIDQKGEVLKLYGINSIPQLFLVDKNGKILAKNLRGEELTKKIEEIFENK